MGRKSKFDSSFKSKVAIPSDRRAIEIINMIAELFKLELG